MKKTKTKNGWIAYQTPEYEVRRIGGVGLCDWCNQTAPIGYLVPVHNCWICPKCYKYFSEHEEYTPEDAEMWETPTAQYYESVIPCDGVIYPEEALER